MSVITPCSPSCAAAHSGIQACTCGCHGANHGLNLTTGRGNKASNRKLTESLIAGDYNAQVTLSPEQNDAVGSYTGAGYMYMNKWLREGFHSGDEYGDGGERTVDMPYEVPIITDLMDQYQLPGHMTAFRGTNHFPQLPEGNAVGQTITVPGFTSTSLGDTVSSGWTSNNFQIKLNLPKGTNGIAMEGTDHAVNDEREFLLPHNSRWVVTADSTDTFGRRSLEVTVLPPAVKGDMTPAPGYLAEPPRVEDPNWKTNEDGSYDMSQWKFPSFD